MKKAVLFLLILFLAYKGYGQEFMVTGTITDSQNSIPLPGVNITIENTTRGVISNIYGEYNIQVPAGSRLVFSYIGYQEQIIEVSEQVIINISMVPSLEELDEVVVVGYGSLRKSDLTGALSRIQENEEVAGQYSGVDALLQGRASGVQVSANAGNIGGAVSVRIRGTNSLRGNNEPLYVIDGVIINSAAEDVLNASTDANELQTDQNGLTGLNVRDIESVEILKDASATAIYGSRGANGVVLITTKTGLENKGKTRFNSYLNYDYSVISKKIDVLDPLNFARYQNEYDSISGSLPRYGISGDKVYPVSYSDTIPVMGEPAYKLIDWQNRIFQPASSYNAGFSASGGNESRSFYVSGSFADEKGIVETTRMKRTDFTINLQQDVSKRVSLDTRASFMFLDGSFAQAGSRSGGNRSFTKQVLTYRPVIGFTDDNTDDLDLETSNPEAFINDFDDLTQEVRGRLSSALTYRITDGLEYKIQGGFDYRTKSRERWYGTETFKGLTENGYANYSDLIRYSYTVDNILSYTREIKNHRLNATLGLTYDGVSMKNSSYEVSNFPVTTLRSSAPQAGEIALSPFALDYRDEVIFSSLGRLNYSWKNRYIATFSLRSDKSSKFQPGKQTGYFPSFAAAWRISRESFMKDIDFIYNAKLRFGYGEVGNSGIPPYQTLATYNTNYYVSSNNESIIGASPSRIPNTNLSWETTKQLNGGLDFSILKGKISLVMDVYKKMTDDLLLEMPIPESTGFSLITINQGSIENKGIEWSLDAVIFDKKETSLVLGLNMSHNRSQITKLGLPKDKIYMNGMEIEKEFYLGQNVSSGTYFKSPANIFMVGEEIGMFWGLESDGIAQEEEVAAGTLPTYKGLPMVAGDVKFVDHNGDGNLDEADATFIGNPNPDFVFGFSVDFSYKKLTLSALFDGAYGNDIVNGYNMSMGYAEGLSNNIMADAWFQAWRQEAPSDTYPRVGYRDNNSFFSDREVEDGSFFRLNSLNLGIELPKTRFIEKASLNFSVRNLFTLTKYSGFDPQVTSYLFSGDILGVDWVGTPNVKSYVVGLNLNF